jgi:hypothetical protein
MTGTIEKSKLANRIKPAGLALVILLALQLVALALPASAAGSAAYSFASGAFRQVWERQDFPVVSQEVSRSFTWGPEGWAFLQEPYAESNGGQRLVQYFDKARMEITYPKADPGNPYYVTNGLLVKEMVSGQVQEGDNTFRDIGPAQIPVAGDPLNNASPTYASFSEFASIRPDIRALSKTGMLVADTINREGVLGHDTNLGARYGVRYAVFNRELGHNIADVFWTYMNRTGLVYENGRYLTAPVMDWVATMGFPLTEPYWARATIGGQEKDVLVQLYERRVLTYTPSNPDGYKVEMGNVGRHYYNWRYPGRPEIAPWAVVNLSNNSDCNSIVLQLSGQDNLTIEMGAHTTSTYRLGPGVYDYSASGCEAEPKRGTMEFRPNQNFDWPFSILKQIV